MLISKTRVRISAQYMAAVVVFTLYYFFIIFSNVGNHASFDIVSLYAMIGAFTFLGLVNEVKRRAYSLQMMFWFFCFIFYGVSAFIQYLHSDFVYSLTIPESELSRILLLVLLWIISFFIGSKLVSNKRIQASRNKFDKLIDTPYQAVSIVPLLMTVVSVLVLTFLISRHGLTFIFSRSESQSVYQQDSIATTLLYGNVTRNIVAYGLLLTVLYFKKTGRAKAHLVIQAVCCLLVNSPLGLSRYNVGIVYIGLALTLFPSFRRNRLFIIGFFFGFTIVFPVINLFRHTSFLDVSSDSVVQVLDNMTTELLKGDYDAFSMIVNTNRHIAEYGITLGYQLLGVIFFFVPRSIWPSKPLGSGYTVRLRQGGHNLLNVSSPLLAEGLINYGIVGVIILGILVGRFTTYLDKRFWRKKEDEDTITYLDGIYPFMLSMFFFINRGDMLSTVSSSISHIFFYTALFTMNHYLSKVVTEKQARKSRIRFKL